MRFLLNLNVPRGLGTRLGGLGHECRHAGDIGMAQASDVEIVEEARRREEVIVTHDLDYGQLLAFSGEPAPSVILLRLHNVHPDNLLDRISRAWPEIEGPLSGGAIVVLEDATHRIRGLPLSPAGE
jgi:predicted nuclease of predicted toxin-antitoxin system